MDNGFSLVLGLVDFLNVIAYACFCIVIIKFYRAKMTKSQFVMFVIGMVVTLLFAVNIPSYKVVTALGLDDFIIPEFTVFFVGIGFVLSGLALFLSTCKGKGKGKAAMAIAFGEAPSSFNTFAMGTCVVGMVLIYASIIKLSLQKNLKLPIVLICVAVVCAIALPMIATNFNVFSEIVQWIIEITNIGCQVCLLISTILVLKDN